VDLEGNYPLTLKWLKEVLAIKEIATVQAEFQRTNKLKNKKAEQTPSPKL
jgi:hypothetical protein